MSKKLTREECLDQFYDAHGKRYDYSLFEYLGDKILSTIICRIHGNFKQLPKTHKRGQGCPKCGKATRLEKIAKRKITEEKFIERCVDAHGLGRYDLSLAKYKGQEKKVIFSCPIDGHGIFYQTPKDHWRGFGCPRCANKNLSNEEYIKKLKKVRGNKYDYSLVNYILSTEEIIIICKTHGPFKQIARNHLQGADCPKCNNSKVTKNQKKLYEELKKQYNTFLEYKINLTNKKYYYVDIYIPEKNLVIEYYGDYWHCNPKKYKPDYYHKHKKMYAKDIWDYDQQRKQQIENMGYKIFIVWEYDWKHDKENVINNIINCFSC